MAQCQGIQESTKGARFSTAINGAALLDRRLHLKQKLQAREEYLQAAAEELESANEELTAANDEMQSVNEEMQSTNEELETSKEELQSLNEELSTVNTELQTKVADLTRVNNDMNNLLAGTGIGTVFVDHQLRILRFTPAVTQIINLIQSDVGRPVAHIVSNLVNYADLLADAEVVLNTLIPKEVDVETRGGRWYTMRIQPYRTLDNAIEGAVITFVDVTERKRVEDELKKATEDIQTLRGILPICSNCKKIRDDHGYWNDVEVYVRDHSEANFSHGLCPGCMTTLYPEYDAEIKKIPEKS
jgi:PAS domain-containing protein